MRLRTIVFLAFIVFGLTAKAQIKEENLYKSKVEKYTKLKKTGFTMGIVGGAATIGGVVLVNKADWSTDHYNSGVSYNTEDGSGVAGVVLLVVGVPLTIAGLILGGVGNSKAKKYQKKLDGLSINATSTSQMTGLRLTYNF